MVSDTIETVTTYEPFGKVIAQTGIDETAYGFTGEQEDAATGFVYLRARYYNPSLKIFMSRDPFGGISVFPASQHPYTYAHNNPVNLTDPSGQCIWDACVVETAVVVVAAAVVIYVVADAIHDALAPSIPHIGRVLSDFFDDCTDVFFRTPTPPAPPSIPRATPRLVPQAVLHPQVTVVLVPAPQPQPEPSRTPVPIPPDWPDDNRSGRVIVELGAGDYSNAIALKMANPSNRVIATNSISDWEAGKEFYEGGLSSSIYPQIGFYTGWLTAQSQGVEVGVAQPYENKDIPGGIADIVYTILPYPTTAQQFGRDAARIAKYNSGTTVAITAVSSNTVNDFRNGFNSVRPGSEFIPVTGTRFGEPGDWEEGTYTTWIYTVP